MKRAVIAALVVFAVAGTTAVYAQHWPGHWRGAWRQSADDMSAFADARIAAVKAGLRLSAEQERLWPPVEEAARDLARHRIDRIAERREGRRDGYGWGPRSPDDVFDRLRRRADSMAASAASMQRLAEAAEPLYRTLSEDQKRRLVALASPHAGPHWRERWDERHPRWRERTGMDEPFGRDQQQYHEPPRRESGRI